MNSENNPNSERPRAILAIDFGTTNSAAAFYDGSQVQLLEPLDWVSLGSRKGYPSYFAVTPSGDILVGEPARRQVDTNARGVVARVKRSMGTDRTFQMPNGVTYTPEQIAATIITKLRDDAQRRFQRNFDRVVVTIPAYYNEAQRRSTLDAIRIAGLEPLPLLHEPTAAAISYGYNLQQTEGVTHPREVVLVFDLGGGTLDITVMAFEDGVFDVLATSGDTQLGGSDIDQAFLESVTRDIESTIGRSLESSPELLSRLRQEVERAKIELSTVPQTELNLFGLDSSGNPVTFNRTYTRTQLNDIIDSINFTQRCATPINQALSDSSLNVNQIDNVILVGGPTTMPIIRDFINSFFNREALQSVDPMTCVVQGAAIQAATHSGEVSSIVTLDVLPISIGLETQGGVFTPLLSRNSKIPTRETKTFTTAEDNQTSVDVVVYQGERQFVQDCRRLGSFRLENIPQMPRHQPQIEVTFDINLNGILNVSAREVSQGSTNSLTIQETPRYTEEQIQRMVREAEEFSQSDQTRRQNLESVQLYQDLVRRIRLLLGNQNLSEEQRTQLTELSESLNAQELTMESSEEVFTSTREVLTRALTTITQIEVSIQQQTSSDQSTSEGSTERGQNNSQEGSQETPSPEEGSEEN